MFLPGVSNQWHNQLDVLYFILNSKGLDEDYYRSILMPKYQSLIADIGLNWNDDFGLGIGSPDSFMDLNFENCIQVLTDLLKESDELTIELSNNRRNIRYSNSEKYLYSGVGHISSSPYHPIFKNNLTSQNELIHEFENIIQSNPTEKKLENFLKQHYKDIFGFKYDRIETQMWLKFPQLDINNKNRCIDIFLHNTVISDWELFELKKIIPLTKTYRDIPTLTSEIYTSIQQILNYERLLKQDNVKEYFKREGIEYFEPSLHLVVGKSPTVSTSQWRWLINTNRSVKLTTYDELIEEMKLRYCERESAIIEISNQ